MEKLKTYNVFVKVFVLGETEDDALESAYSAIDQCDLLSQDGIVGLEIVDDVDELDFDFEEED